MFVFRVFLDETLKRIFIPQWGLSFFLVQLSNHKIPQCCVLIFLVQLLNHKIPQCYCRRESLSPCAARSRAITWKLHEDMLHELLVANNSQNVISATSTSRYVISVDYLVLFKLFTSWSSVICQWRLECSSLADVGFREKSDVISFGRSFNQIIMETGWSP